MIVLDELQIINLHKEIGSRLLERLSYIKCQPENILDFGYNSEYLLKKLSVTFNKAKLQGFIIIDQLNKIQNNIETKKLFDLCIVDPENLPLEDDSKDLIISNLAIDYTVIDLNKCFKELYRILKPNGILLFVMELKSEALINIGNILLINGFYDPVVDQELITLNYKNKKSNPIDQLINFKIIYGYALRRGQNL